jgi:hypothetical protein
MLQVNAGAEPGQFYQYTINNLCAGANLYFSAWITSILINNGANKTNMIFVIESASGSELARYSTGDIPDINRVWKHYGFEFTVPAGQTSVVLRIINNGTGTGGNDFIMDDIEIRFCAPPVNMAQSGQVDTVACLGTPFTFTGTYTDDGVTFGNALISRWERNVTGDLNNPSAWLPVEGTLDSANGGSITNTYSLTSVTLEDTGYYRLAVANSTNIDSYNCRAMSDIIHLRVVSGAVSGTVSPAEATVCNTGSVPLTATPSSGGSGTLVYQWQQSVDGGSTWSDVTGGSGETTLSYTTPTLTATTKYRLRTTTGGSASCGTAYSNTATVTVLPPNACGATVPSGCALTGTLLFKEDFGGNNPNDPPHDSLPSGITGYAYAPTSMASDAVYCLTKLSKANDINSSVWYNSLDDHTYPNDTNRGYMLQVNAGAEPGQFYQYTINNLCAGANLYFSAWITSIMRTNGANKTNMVFVIESASGSELARYSTGDIPDGNPNWKHYGFEFTVPAGETSVVLRIINNGTGTGGNDFIMDDIEIRFCAPPVSMAQSGQVDTVACLDTPFTFAGSYTDTDGTFGNPLISRWERNITGDLNNPLAWETVTGTEKSENGNSITNTYFLTGVTLADTGYYRLAVANSTNIGYYNCRAMSNIVHLRVVPGAVSGTVSPAEATVCNTGSVLLTATASTGGSGTLSYQWQQSVDGNTWANVTGGSGATSLSYTTPTLTATTKYRLRTTTGGTAACETVYSDTATVTVLPPNACGTTTPSGCALTGTLLYREDFGGNNSSDADIATTDLPNGITTYTFVSTTSVSDGQYTLTKHFTGTSWWYDFDDHTIAGTDRGYFMLVNASHDPGLFYTTTITGLCANLNLYFSVWVGNLVPPSPSYSSYIKPKLRFELRDPNSNLLLASQSTGDIPIAAAASTWTQYGISFNTGSNTSVKLMIYNDAPGGNGNDLVLDDIEIRFCAPEVIISQPLKVDTTVCVGSPFIFAGSYTDDPATFGNPLISRWERNATGDLNNPLAWETVLGTEKSENSNSITNTYSLTGVTLEDTGYYRLAVANSANIGYYNCRAMSDIVHLRVVPGAVSGTVSPAEATVCNTGSVPLTATASTGGSGTLFYQWQQSVDGNTWANVTGGSDGTTLSYTTPTLTATTKYRLRTTTGGTASCDTAYSNTATVTVQSVNCGTIDPSGCALTGTVVFKEDFGGNDPSDPAVKPGGISQVTGYSYTGSGVGPGTYGIRKVGSINGSNWYTPDDHTFPGDPTRGYLLQVDASGSPGQFYVCTIDDLCVGTKLYFSVWLMSVSTGSAEPSRVNQKFSVEDLSGNILAEYYTGDVPDSDPNWKQYGFEFTVPMGQTSIILRITNNNSGAASGNDFVMDDIEIRFCTPPVTQLVEVDTTVCVGTLFTFTGSYTDTDGTFGDDLISRWERNVTGDLNNPSAWETVGTPNSADDGSITTTYSLTSVTLTDTGYYRLAVANSTNIGNYNCRAMSDIIRLRVVSGAVSGTVSPSTTVCYNSPVTLTSTASTGGSSTLVYQWQQSVSGVWTDISGATDLTYITPSLTATAEYRLQTVGGTAACETVYSDPVTVTVYDRLSQGVAHSDTAVCYNTAPNTLLGGAPGGGKGDDSYSYQWQQSDDDGANWENVPSDGTFSNYSPPALTQTLQYRRIVLSDGGSCGRDTSNVLTVKVYPQAILNYPDFRIWACPGASGDKINLSKYLDTIESPGIVWGAAAGSPPINASGIIDADKLVAPNTYTYTYTVTNPCIGNMTRKIYLKMLGSNGLKQPQDTVTICYETAEAVNINQIFGIDAGGTWMYVSPDGNISAYVTESAAYGGAVIMNGKGIYENTSIGFYGTTNTKRVVFTYTPAGSCLDGKTYKMVIILTPDMM